MRLFSSQRTKKSLAVLAAGLACAAVAWGVVPVNAWAASVDRPNRTCLSFTGTDYSHLTIRDAGAPGTSSGDSVVYHDEIFDASGKQVGYEDGTALVYDDPADGSLREWLSAVAVFPDGTVFWNGPISLLGAAGGQEQFLSAVGTAGRLRGMAGVWHWKLVTRQAPDLSIFQGGYRVCGRVGH